MTSRKPIREKLKSNKLASVKNSANFEDRTHGASHITCSDSKYRRRRERRLSEDETMNRENPEIEERLIDVASSILCPVAECWFKHGSHYAYFWDDDCQCHALEVWPVGVEQSGDNDGNGHQQTDRGLLYELAEFDFMTLLDLPLEHFHFSQQRQVFEIGWKEDDQDLELWVHIVPEEVNEDGLDDE